jgi:adenosylmethionine-8-amino-7-oxononanoate aminotransferase
MQGVQQHETAVLPRLLDLAYPNIERGEGVWLYDSGGRRILDACGGGAMAACLGHGSGEIADVAAGQAGEIAYVYNHFFTSEPQERLAERLLEVAGLEMTRVKFASGGSEANEAALRLARSFHAERGESKRWRVISQAQSYHGATLGTLGLTGRRSLQEPYREYLADHLHVPPSTWRSDPSGEAALAEIDRILEVAGADTIAAFFCEPVSAAALPAYAPPKRFWEGLAERRERHGFLICLDEIVTGMGRTGRWFASQGLPIAPDIVTTAKGLGAGYAPLSAMMCRQQVYEAIASGSRIFEHGHTWDGAPLPCAVGLAVLDQLVERDLVDHVRERGPGLRDELAAGLDGADIVGDVRGHGFLLGVAFVDPRDGESFLPEQLDAASLLDGAALEHELLVISTHSTQDGYAGDQALLAPAYTSTDAELAEMVERFVVAVGDVERMVKKALTGPGGAKR